MSVPLCFSKLRSSTHCRLESYQPFTIVKGLRPLPPTPADSRIFGFFDFPGNVDFGDFPVGFGVWEGLQWIGNGCGLQMDGFSAHSDKYESIFDDVHDFGCGWSFLKYVRQLFCENLTCARGLVQVENHLRGSAHCRRARRIPGFSDLLIFR